MKAVVCSGPGQIDLEDVAGARLEQSTDAVVRLTMSAICGTDLHMVRGTMPGKQPGTVLGHEGVGVVGGGRLAVLRIARHAPGCRVRCAFTTLWSPQPHRTATEAGFEVRTERKHPQRLREFLPTLAAGVSARNARAQQ